MLFRTFSVEGNDYLYDTGTNAIVSLPAGVRPRLEEGGPALAVDPWVVRARERSGLLSACPPRDYRSTLNREGISEGLEKGMRGLLLGVTDRCNLRCSYCIYSGSYEGQRTHGTESMTWEVARKSIDHFLAHRASGEVTYLTFYGGEPFLAWDLVRRCIEYVREQEVPDLVLLVNTNLTLLDEARAAFLAENRVALAVSVDGPAWIHDSARRYASGRPSHDKVLKRLEHLRTTYSEYWEEYVLVQATLSREGDMGDVFDFFCGEEWKDLSISVAGIQEEGEWEHPEKDELLARHQTRLDELLARHLRALEEGEPFAHKLFQNLFKTVFKTLPERKIGYAPPHAKPMRTCIPGVARLFVDSQGFFYPCEKTGVPAARIGDVETGIDEEAVHGLLERQVRFAEEHCQGCWAWRLCGLCLTHFLEGGQISETGLLRKCDEERERALRSLERFTYLYTREPPDTWEHPFSLHQAVAKGKSTGG